MRPEAYTSDDLLSVFDLCRNGSRVLGPGLRYVIWTQGCPFRCDGCITPSSRPIINDRLVRVDALAADILDHPNINGITISGGEPFLQAGALANMLDIVLSKQPQLTIIAYTGYKIEDLTMNGMPRLLSHLDLLVDGPYMKHLNDNKGIRGSSNQRLHFLTSRLLPWKEEMENTTRKVEYHLTNEKIKAFGVPPASVVAMA